MSKPRERWLTARVDAVTVRVAEPDDALALGALQLRWDLERGAVRRADFIRRYCDEWLACLETRPAWIAKAPDGNPIGFVLGAHIATMPSLVRPRNGWLHLSAVYVDADRRRQGIGELLLRAVLAWAPQHDVTRIQLAADDGARGLCERVGFTLPSEHLMELRLPQPPETEMRLF